MPRRTLPRRRPRRSPAPGTRHPSRSRPDLLRRGALPVPERAATQHPATRATNTVALLDSGQRLPFARALVVGRNPTADARGEQRFSWPDLSRTLSKTHARLEWDGESVWVTDLGSANGTAMEVGAERAPLDPFVPARMPADAVLWLGDRSLTIAGSRRDRPGASDAADTRHEAFRGANHA
ncbi:FHA domain-containing protein [Microbacterium sp. NPDC090003]|uniref:FHA domain-containing protein n=1 Tax=Microbacterium sp. NPDC090003 TaxID=3364203 RepID=UPI00381ED826